MRKRSRICLSITVATITFFLLTTFVFPLPFTTKNNILRCFNVAIAMASFSLYNLFNLSDANMKKTNDLRLEYHFIDNLVRIHTNILYKGSSKNYKIDSHDTYLFTLKRNFSIFNIDDEDIGRSDNYIQIACVVDALLQNWKIVAGSNKVRNNTDLIALNCKLATSVALSLMDLNYCTLKNNNNLKDFLNFLYINFNKDSRKANRKHFIIEYAERIEILNGKVSKK